MQEHGMVVENQVRNQSQCSGEGGGEGNPKPEFLQLKGKTHPHSRKYAYSVRREDMAFKKTIHQLT